jgi:hypothetical protein
MFPHSYERQYPVAPQGFGVQVAAPVESVGLMISR